MRLTQVILLILQILIISKYKLSYCPQTVFPTLLGGPGGATVFYSIDIDSNENIAFAGYSEDQTLLGAGANQRQPIIGIMEEGATYKWVKTVAEVGQSFQRIRYNQAKTKLFVMTSLVGLKLFQVDPSDGSFISGVEETTMLMKPSGRNYMELDSSDNVYIAMQDINNKYLIVSIQGSTVLTFQYDQIGIANGIAFAQNYQFMWVGGTITQSSVSINTINRFSTSTFARSVELTIVLESSQVSAIFDYVRSNTIGGYEWFYGNYKAIAGASNLNKLCIIQYDPVLDQVLTFARIQGPSGFSYIIHFDALSDSEAEVAYFHNTNGRIFFGHTNWVTQLQTWKHFQVFSGTNFISYYIYDYVTSPKYGILIAGTATSFGGGTPAAQTLAQSHGLVISYDSTFRCLGLSFTTVAFPFYFYQPNTQTPLVEATLSQVITFSTMTPYTFTDVVNGFLTYNCNTMNVYSATTSTAGITLTYYIGGGPIIQAITKIALDCSLIDASFLTYNIVIDTLNSDPTALAAAVETIDVVNYQITWETSDRNLDTLFMIYTISTYVSTSRQTFSYTLTVTFKKYDCENVVITGSTIADVTFDIRDGDNFELAAVDWPQTNSALCPYVVTLTVTRQEDSLTYTTIKKVDVVAPSQFSIQTLGLTLDGTYTVLVSADVPSVIDYTSSSGLNSVNLYSTSFVVTVPSLCTYNQVTAVVQSQIPQQVYLGQSTQYIANAFTQTYVQCNNLVYSVTGLPTFITFTPLNREFVIYTVDNTLIGLYTVTLTCTDTLTASTASTPYQFEILEMIYSADELLMPYYFKFSDIKFKPGYKGIKPIFIDVYKAIQFFNVFDLQTDFGWCSDFVKYDNHQLVINSTTADEGICDLKFLGDRQIDQKQQIFIVQLIMQDFKPEEPPPVIVPIENLGNGKISAKIASINHHGLVTIRFNDTLDMPDNVTFVHMQNTLRMKVRDGISNTIDERVQNVSNYTAISYKLKDLVLQLKFSDEKRISQRSIQDQLEITFLKNEYYRKGKANISRYTVIKRPLPQQIFNSTEMQILEYFVIWSENTLWATILINLFLQLAVKFSTKLLWRMMAILQLVVNLPLMGINIPSNMILCFEAFIRITSLQIVDKALIKKYAFSYLDSSNDEIADQLQNGDIFQKSNLLRQYITLKTIWIYKHINQYRNYTGIFGCVCSYRIANLVYQDFISKNKSLVYVEQQDDTGSIVAVFMMIFVCFIPFMVFVFLNYNELKWGDEQFKAKFGTMYLAVNPKNPFLVFDSSIFYARRLVYGICCIFLVNYGVFQLFITSIITLQVLEYQVLFMHLDSKTSNRMEIFNEFSLLVILIITLVLVGDIIVDLDLRYSIGWVNVFIAANFFILNILVIWYKLMKKLYKMIKKMILKIKQKRLMKKRMSTMGKYLVAKHVSTPSHHKLIPTKKESTDVMSTDGRPIDFRFLRHESTKSAGKSEIFNQIIVEQLEQETFEEKKRQDVKSRIKSSNNVVMTMKKIPSSSLFKNQKHALDAPSPRGNNYLETSSNSNINNNLIAAKTKQNNYHNRNNHKSSLNNLSQYAPRLDENDVSQNELLTGRNYNYNDESVMNTSRVNPPNLVDSPPLENYYQFNQQSNSQLDPSRKYSQNTSNIRNLNIQLDINNGFLGADSNRTPQVQPSILLSSQRGQNQSTRKLQNKVQTDYFKY